MNPIQPLTTRLIDVVDYGGGNLGSALRCLSRLGCEYRLVGGEHSENSLPTGENPLLFPGVGAFGAAMANLEKDGLGNRVRELVRAGTPYLGICIGLQVLFEGSEEAPDTPGLGLIPGKVVRFTQGKVPQIGWNRIEPAGATHEKDGWDSGHVYFVNSYYPQLADPTDALYNAYYYAPFTAAVKRKNILAFQFHPEKSGPFGQELIRRWLHDLG